MKNGMFRIGVYIEDEFVEYAICTTDERANRAKELLEKAMGEEDGRTVEIIPFELNLNVVVIDGIEIDLN